MKFTEIIDDEQQVIREYCIQARSKCVHENNIKNCKKCKNSVKTD